MILQDQAITSAAITSISEEMSEDPTWQDGEGGDMCPLCAFHITLSHTAKDTTIAAR
jgi:hypothetical protein